MIKGKIKSAEIDGHDRPPRMVEIDAEIYGPIAVAAYEGREYIYHVSSGYVLTPVITNKRKARKLAAILEKHADAFTRLSTKRNTQRNKAACEIVRQAWLEVGLKQYWR